VSVAGSKIAPAPRERSPEDGSSGQAERAGAFMRRAEVRDVLAWLRLLVDPHDAAAVVRALARPPIELSQVELARAIQVARRRTPFGGTGKLGLALGLAAAIESPRVPPEARERIEHFVRLHASASAELDTLAPDVFVARLIGRLRAEAEPLLSVDDAAEQRASLDRLEGLAADYVRSRPRANTRDLARHLATVAPAAQTPAADDAAPAEGQLESMLARLREQVLEDVARIGGRLGELRLDTELDVAHGVARYLELLKVSALLQRRSEESVEEALADVNARLLAAATPLEREIFQTSSMDRLLVASQAEQSQAGAGRPQESVRAGALSARERHSLTPFLPRRGAGLSLSASDIQTYRSCPLRYKFARVLRIPVDQTVHQRFGIVVHQVLERYHRERGQTLTKLLELLDGCWQRAGFGREDRYERELLERARAALTRYHAREAALESEPVWFERQFEFRVGPHHLRGRVDRVDRLPAAGTAQYELIDYKTSRPKSAEQLLDDVQLSLYALAAREAWQIYSTSQAYHYILDDVTVPIPNGDAAIEAVKDVVLEVGEGILVQEFDPTPSQTACAACDYRIVCPATLA
jgi:RecB family exonuclease